MVGALVYWLNVVVKIVLKLKIERWENWGEKYFLFKLFFYPIYIHRIVGVLGLSYK